MKPRLQVCKKCQHFGEGGESGIHVYVCFLEFSTGQLLAEMDSHSLGGATYKDIPDKCPYTLEHTVLPWSTT